MNKIMPEWLIESDWGALIVVVGIVVVAIFSFVVVGFGALMAIPGIYIGMWAAKRLAYLNGLKEE